MEKKVSLKRLTLINYRGIEFEELIFDGSSKIVGENRIGKTSTIEALYWLLTDRLLDGSKGIEQIKPLNNTAVTVSVSGVFDVDGQEFILGKNFKEEWVKTRGSEELTFKGHTTIYLYNGTKVETKKTFDALFAADFGLDDCNPNLNLDIVQMLVNPLYLGNMGDTDDWKTLRGLIIKLVGDVNDSDVFAANPKLKPIEEDLNNCNGRTDMLAKQYRDKYKGIEEDIIRVEGAIESYEKTPRPTDEEVALAKKGIAECDAKINELKGQYTDDKATLYIDEEIVKLKEQIVERKRELYEKRKETSIEKKNEALRQEKSKKMSTMQELVVKKTSLKSQIEFKRADSDRKTGEVNELTKKRLNLIDELNALDKQIENPAFETCCPYCHKPYDEDKIEEIKARVLKELNIKKAELITRGKANTQKMHDIEDEVMDLDKEIEELKMHLERIESSIEVLTQEIKDLDAQILVPTEEMQTDTYFTDPIISKLEGEIAKREGDKIEIRNSVAKRDASVSAMIQSEEENKETYQKVVDDFKYWERAQANKGASESQKKEMVKTRIQLEQKIDIIKMFIKAKLEMLNEHIESVFGKDIKFMLIEPQINGGYSTVCKPYIKGTDTLWKSGSKSEKITTGVAICEKVKKALNMPDMPYIFDEGSEITRTTFENRFDTNSQLICVQPKDNIMKPTVVKI